MFGALWSEHCGYKHSKQLIRTFPSESPYLLTAPGQENAGVIDIGDGLAAVIKVESHNHPSAVEPYQGAATGVGGIVRDILAMGARPIALLNSLRFGPLTEPRNRHLFQGVVGGISGYGNCIGVPDVGGEIAFDSSYSGNPLVNALCVGIVPSNSLVRAVARTPGQPAGPGGRGNGTRRHTRGIGPGIPHVRRGDGAQAHGTGGQSLHGKGAHRSLSGSGAR